MAEEESPNKSKVRELRRKSKLHSDELSKISKQESKLLKDDGYEERSHKFIWIFIIVAIIVAILWFLFAKRAPIALRIPLVHP